MLLNRKTDGTDWTDIGRISLGFKKNPSNICPIRTIRFPVV